MYFSKIVLKCTWFKLLCIQHILLVQVLYDIFKTLKWLIFGSTTEFVSFIYLHVQVYSNESALSCNILE